MITRSFFFATAGLWSDLTRSSAFGAEVMGTRHWSVVEVTRHYRPIGVPGTDAWAVISEDHAGNPVGMDKDGAIWIHDHEFGGISPLANGFEEYVRVQCLRLPKDGRFLGAACHVGVQPCGPFLGQATPSPRLATLTMMTGTARRGRTSQVADHLGRTTDYQYDVLARRVREILRDPHGAGPQTRPETLRT